MPETVTVGCKMPNGLVLRVFDQEDFDEPVLGGGYRTVKRAIARNERVKINGYLKPNRGGIEQASQPAAYALTHNVDRAFMEMWLEQNKQSALVKKELIIVHHRPGHVDGMVREHAAEISGFEPINPAKPPRVGRGVEQIKSYDGKTEG